MMWAKQAMLWVTVTLFSLKSKTSEGGLFTATTNGGDESTSNTTDNIKLKYIYTHKIRRPKKSREGVVVSLLLDVVSERFAYSHSKPSLREFF